MHVDTGHNFPEVLDYRDRRVQEAGARLIVASVQESIDAGRVGEETGRFASRNRLQTTTLLDAHRRASLRRGIRRRPARRGEGQGQGAGLLLPGRVRPVGPQEPAARAVEPLQHPDPPRRAHPGLPAVQLDRARHLALHRPGAAGDPVDLLLPTERQVFERDGILLADNAFVTRGDDEPLFDARVRYRTVGDMTCTGAVAVQRRRRSTRSSTRSPPPGSPSGARPVPTTGPARPPWRTASGRATSDDGAPRRWQRSRQRGPPHGHPPARHGRLRRRWQEHADRTAAVRLQGHLRGPARGGRADQPRARRRVHQPGAADRRPARRARAGHHHRRGLPLLRHAPAQVHHRRHPRAHSVHPQHGHRRLDGRPGDRPGRRPQRADRAEPPARLPGHPAARPAPGAGRQQDGPGRLRPARSSSRSSRSSPPSRPSWRSAT